MSEQDSRLASNSGNLPGQAAWPAPNDGDARLRTVLGRARSLYGNGAFADAIDALRSVNAAAEQADDRSPDASHARLVGSALALEGRALHQLGRDEEARDISRSAVQAFDRVPPTGADAVASQDERIDAAIALYLAGGADVRAQDELQRVIASGGATADTYRFLGLTLLRLESQRPGEEALRASLSLEHLNVRTLQALAQCLEMQPSRPAETADVYYDLARAQYLAGHLREAADACARTVELAPAADRCTTLGFILGGLSRYDEAMAAFDRALAIDPSYTEAQFRKGELLRIRGQLQEAVSVLQAIPESAEQHVLVLGSLAAALKALGRYEEALKMADKALAERPDYAFGLVEKGESLIALRRDDEGIETLMRVSETDPAFLRAQFQIADLHRVRGRYEDAVRLSDAILTRDPKLSRVLGTKGGALLGLKKPEEALAVIDHALALEPDYPFGLSIKGDALAQLGKRAEAVTAYARVLELAPDSIKERFNLGENLRLLGRLDDALVVMDEVLKRKADHPAAIGTKGQILAALGRREEAIVLLRRSVELEPTVWARFSLGDALRVTGHHDQALVEFDKILEQDPKNVRTLGWKGDVLLTLKRHDEALAALDLALGIDADNTFALATKGQVLCDQGRRADGVELLQQALALDAKAARATGRPGDLDWAEFVLAENLRVLDRNEEAVAAYDQLLERFPNRVDALGGKASALFSMERYEDALIALNRALDLAPTYAFGLSMQGAVLANCGEYERALEPLTRATAGEDATAYALFVRGFACRVLRRFEEGEAALARAVAIDGENLVARHLLADVYTLSGQGAKAKEIYQAILVKAANSTDPDTVSVVGWCCFRLGDHDRAVQLLVDAVSRGHGMAHAQFDLALSLLCSHREGLAAREYDRGIEMSVAEHHPWRQRGLFRLALADIANARQEYADGLTGNTTVEEIESRLRARLAGLPAVTLPSPTTTKASA